MTKIVPIRHCDIGKIVKMIEYVTPGLSPGMITDNICVPVPFNTLHTLLPLHLKFLQESYVAIENDEPLGLISLAPDGKNKTRWKINRLILGVNAYDVGKQLIDYVVNKYGGAGVEIFLTVIDENYAEAIALFKNACFFRNCSKINIWELNDTPRLDKIKEPDNLRSVKEEDFQKIFELDSESLFPQFKTSLVKTPEDFKFGIKNKIIDKIKGYEIHKYALDNPAKDRIEAALSVQTADKKNYWVDVTVSLPYKDYYGDLVNFAVKNIKLENPEAKIYIGIKDYQQTAKFMTEVLAQNNFKLCGNFQVLVKDYWKPASVPQEQKIPAIIFPDMTSPACNIIKFITGS